MAMKTSSGSCSVIPAAIASFALGMVVFASNAVASVSYRQNVVNIIGGSAFSHGSAAYELSANNALATHAFLYQQQSGPCVPTPAGLYAFFLNGLLSNYFYVQNCDGVWVGDGQYHWTMYDFSGPSPCGSSTATVPCGSFNFADWAANSYSILLWSGGAYLDPNGKINPALILQGDTTIPPPPLSVPPPLSANGSLDSGPWPTLGHDNQRTNRSNLQGPSTPNVSTLVYDAGTPVNLSNITVTSDGKILLSSCTAQVIAIDAAGKSLPSPWPYQLLPTVFPGSPETAVGLTVSSDGHIYVATHECPDIPGGVPAHFYSIESNGASAPNWPVSSRAMYWPSAIASTGTIFQMDEFNIINAYYPDGTTIWNIGLPSYGQGAIALDTADNLYVGTDSNLAGGHSVYSFTSSGASRPGWPQDTGGLTAQTTPVISTDGGVFIANIGGTLFGFNSDGSSRAGFPFSAGGTVSQQPLAISASGTIYMKTSLGLFAINPNGTQAWAGPFSPGGSAFLSPGPVVDASGNIFVAFGDNVYSLDSTGAVRPGWPVTVPSAGYMVIGGNGVLYVVSAGQRLYSIASGSGTGTAPIIGPAGGTVNPQQSSNEPISTGNGNYYYTHTDFVIPGRGMPLMFSRQYNSLDNYTGPLGANWTDSYNIFLMQDPGGNATIKWGDGHNETFTPSGTGYTDQPGVFSTLTKNADASFLLIQKNQTQYNFSAAGKLTSIQDRNRNTILLTYDSSGNLSEVTDSVGRSLTFSYDGSNRITQVSDPIGRTVTFSYDASDNLLQATDSAGGITQFAYDASHRVTSITLPNGQLLLENAYDNRGRVVSQKNGRRFAWTFAYDTPNPGETTITDARGNKTIHTYDSSLRIVSITDALGGTTSFTYDANNDRTSVTNPNGKTTNFAYDTLGNVTSITDPLAHTVAFTYDAKNNLLTTTNAKGNTTSFSYDANGNLTEIQDALGTKTTFAYDGSGELTSKTDARGSTTSYSYDISGNLVKITDALGNVTSLGYDGVGRLISITDPNGHTASATYDALSRLVKIADPLGDATQFAHDPLGNLLKITDANGNATSYGYDATNNLVSVTDAMGHVTRYGYDEDNNRTAFTNAKGNTTSYAFDALNRLASITDPLSFVTSYAYDAAGNVVATTDAKGQTNRIAYDALNRLIAISYADGKSVAYSYDADGNRTVMVDSHGTTDYAYDVLDRLTSVTHPGGKVVSYGYDSVGNRQSLAYPDGKTVSYAYDPANRLSQVKDWLGRTTSYGYDAASNLLQVLYPNHAGVSFSYDAANRLIEAQNRFRGSGEEDDEGDANPIAVFRYVLDRVGNRLQVVDGSGKITRYGYDPLYELTSVQKFDEDDAEAEDSGGNQEDGKTTLYTYDAVGNRLSFTGPHHLSLDYAYDADDRLLRAGASTFTYDADGNQTSKTQTPTGEPFVYSYDAANRLISVIGGRFNSSFMYDGDGNRVSQSTRAGTLNYLNDVATALPVVLQESGPDGNISYAYGLSRISESSPEFDSFYQYDGLGSVVGLTDPRGHLKVQYAYDAWGQAVPSNDDDRVRTRDRFRFTSEALDPNTQLYYLRARYYDATIGRFISGDAQFLKFVESNAYTYAVNNPPTYIDPSGYFQARSNSVSQASLLVLYPVPPQPRPVPAGQTLSVPTNTSSPSGLTKKLGELYVTCVFGLAGGGIADCASALAKSALKDALITDPDLRILLKPSFFTDPQTNVQAQLRLSNRINSWINEHIFGIKETNTVATPQPSSQPTQAQPPVPTCAFVKGCQ